MTALNLFSPWMHGIIKSFIFLLVAVLLSGCQTTPKWVPHDGTPVSLYPGVNWPKTIRPELMGWSARKLAEAKTYADTIDTAAVMIVDDGVVVDAWGDITRKFQCHSMRKSLLSAMIGIQVDRGNHDPGQDARGTRHR